MYSSVNLIRSLTDFDIFTKKNIYDVPTYLCDARKLKKLIKCLSANLK